MRFKLLFVPMLVTICYLSTGCVNNSEEGLYGDDCDTLNMTYSKVKYIFQDNCYACHTEAYYNHNIKTDTYNNLKAAVNTGKLWPAINHTGDFKMPKDRTEKLPDCQIAMIGAWINKGMPE